MKSSLYFVHDIYTCKEMGVFFCLSNKLNLLVIDSTEQFPFLSFIIPQTSQVNEMIPILNVEEQS